MGRRPWSRGCGWWSCYWRETGGEGRRGEAQVGYAILGGGIRSWGDQRRKANSVEAMDKVLWIAEARGKM